MTREEAIDCLIGTKIYLRTEHIDIEAIDMAIEALSSEVEQTDCTEFIHWLMEEVMDEDNWELNAVANGEIICRKLKKLGLLKVEDGYYVRTSSIDVDCSTCKHKDKGWDSKECDSCCGNNNHYKSADVV